MAATGVGEGATRVAVLTVSDGVAAGRREDRAGARIAEGLRARGMVVAERAVVPDDAEAIRRRLLDWCDGPAPPQVVVTLGGTGLGPRDVTPEATRAVLDREAPGLAEALRAAGARATLAAYLSRGVAGVRGRTLVVNVAGSEGAAQDAVELLGRLLPHAAHVLAGGGHEAGEGWAAARPPGVGGRGGDPVA
ncbi:MAG: MogA/MoaB family molybdenum cofactor biosynthesis protein [Firmicutes bacterium]|nr:MogA/MoaB family molybdenum cofactor biosynthesis protein [Bacillota bacterium]